jgi:hypothetical protein
MIYRRCINYSGDCKEVGVLYLWVDSSLFLKVRLSYIFQCEELMSINLCLFKDINDWITDLGSQFQRIYKPQYLTMSFATTEPAESNFVQGVLVFWNVTLCRKVSEILRFEGNQCFHFPRVRYSKKNDRTHSSKDRTLHSRKFQHSTTSLLTPQISHTSCSLSLA